MKIFHCSHCGNPLYFENTVCLSCGSHLGYLEHRSQLVNLIAKNGLFSVSGDEGKLYRFCKNHEYQVCNWLVEINSDSEFCTACSLNRTIPNLENESNLVEWRKLEIAKHRLVYALMRLGLQVEPKKGIESSGIAFDFLEEITNAQNSEPVRTGHLNGTITINVAEADSVHREYMRKQMAEPYRTLIGHFRHEIGHFYWDLLINNNSDNLSAFRSIFGDERVDYGAALQNHYNQGASSNWPSYYISSYASSHPWEDWAETWAHYLHLIDLLETAFYFGIETGGHLNDGSPLKMEARFDPYLQQDFDAIIKAFRPLTYAINSLNRSMGQPDVYPFVISDTVLNKLRFVHQLLH